MINWVICTVEFYFIHSTIMGGHGMPSVFKHHKTYGKAQLYRALGSGDVTA